jgi:hypothetical protein
VLGREDLLDDPRFATCETRAEHGRVDAVISSGPAGTKARAMRPSAPPRAGGAVLAPGPARRAELETRGISRRCSTPRADEVPTFPVWFDGARPAPAPLLGGTTPPCSAVAWHGADDVEKLKRDRVL